MFPLVRNVIGVLRRCPLVFQTSNYHAMFRPKMVDFLSPAVLNLIPNCGFKVKGRLRRRCRDCYFVMREQRLYVLCKSHGRHKQMSMVKDPKSTWILTHATQGKVRPW